VYQKGQNLEGDALKELKLKARQAGTAAWVEQLGSTYLTVHEIQGKFKDPSFKTASLNLFCSLTFESLNLF